MLPVPLTQPAPGVGQRPNGQPPGGDSLLVAPQADRVGSAEYIRMPDIYPAFPYGRSAGPTGTPKWTLWCRGGSRRPVSATSVVGNCGTNPTGPGTPPTGATSTQGLAYNGGAWSSISYPPTSAWGVFGATVSTAVNLRAGYDAIRLAKGAPQFAGGIGYAELDYIELI